MKALGKAFILAGFFIALSFASWGMVVARADILQDSQASSTVRANDPQQPAPPAMNVAERAQLAFPGFRSGGDITGLFPGRLMSRDFADWPPMRYIGDSAEIAGKTFTLRDVKLVPGSDRPMAYEPAIGKKRLAPEGLRTDLFDFSKNTEVFIPPNTTLVMVKIEVEPEALLPPSKVIGCQTPGERDYGAVLRISYPDQGEALVLRTSHVENFGEFGSPTMFCLTSGWLYFHIGNLTIEQSRLWFEIVDEEFDRELAIWILTHAP